MPPAGRALFSPEARQPIISHLRASDSYRSNDGWFFIDENHHEASGSPKPIGEIYTRWELQPCTGVTEAVCRLASRSSQPSGLLSQSWQPLHVID